MKPTVLELTQIILSSMDSDEVNSISETTESMQVEAILKTCYYDIVSIGELPRDDDIYQLNPSNDADKPILMSLPDDAQDLRWLKYDSRLTDDAAVTYQTLKPLPFYEFLNYVTGFDPQISNVFTYTHTIGSNTWTLYARNDIHPQYYTTTNDRDILFDAYLSTLDTTLQSSKTMAFGQKSFDWVSSDTFVPPLDDKQFQRLLHEAKSLAFLELKQTMHQKAEKSARNIKIDQQASKHKVPLLSDYDLVANMGRNPHGYTKPTGRYK